METSTGLGTDYLSPLELSALIGVTVATLTVWRSTRRGPAYHKLGRSIWYTKKDVQDWIDSKRHITEIPNDGHGPMAMDDGGSRIPTPMVGSNPKIAAPTHPNGRSRLGGHKRKGL